MKVAELTGSMLDLWVGKSDPRCEGLTWEQREDHWAGVCDAGVACFIAPQGFAQVLRLRRQYGNGAEQYAPSLLWQQGGGIIERERISITERGDDGWIADAPGAWCVDGQTPLQAAMRAYVIAKHGEEVPEAETTII